MFLWSCMSLTVLMGVELESGQMVDEIVEKRFSGDFRLGLKVLGKYCLRIDGVQTVISTHT